MQTVETTFKLTFTPEQYQMAVEFVDDMKKNPKRVYWIGKEGKTDEELIYAYIAHRILSGFYNRYSPTSRRQIIRMTNSKTLN